MLNKLRKRKGVLAKVNNSRWGLENRVLAITVHSLIESILRYGLTVTGSAATMSDLDGINQSILNPEARRVTGVSISVRREALYTLADMKSVHNHYILKAANAMDRIMRAKGTQKQQHLQQYLKETQRSWKIWTPGGPIKQIKGPIQRKLSLENIRSWLRRGGNSWWQLDSTRTRWWRLEEINDEPGTSRGEVENSNEGGRSIYCAQAPELDQDSLADHLVFQFAGLRCWRDVAYKALRGVGWEPTCVYEDTIYPKREGGGQINWEMFPFPGEMEPIDRQLGNSLDVYIHECPQADGAIMAIALVISQERWVWADVHVLGRAVAKIISVPTGMALAVGLESLGGILGTGDGYPGKQGPQVKLFADCEPLHDANQRRRWQTYRTPREPFPEHTRLEVQLRNW